MYKKIFFPIGGGEELEERIFGALLISKYFNSHLEIFKAYLKPSSMFQTQEGISSDILEQVNELEKEMFENDYNLHLKLVKKQADKLNVKYSEKIEENIPSVNLIEKVGYRSKLIKNESKFCDLVIVASPHNSRITQTFESTITRSGKAALMFPRQMVKFDLNKILIAWNNSSEVSRAITQSIPLLKKAKEVQIISRKEFVKDINQIEKLQEYLLMHGIKSSFVMIEATLIPGEALLQYANKNSMDLIVAGAFGEKTGIKSFIFGGTTKYILRNTKIPIFMSH